MTYLDSTTMYSPKTRTMIVDVYHDLLSWEIGVKSQSWQDWDMPEPRVRLNEHREKFLRSRFQKCRTLCSPSNSRPLRLGSYSPISWGINSMTCIANGLIRLVSRTYHSGIDWKSTTDIKYHTFLTPSLQRSF